MQNYIFYRKYIFLQIYPTIDLHIWFRGVLFWPRLFWSLQMCNILISRIFFSNNNNRITTTILTWNNNKLCSSKITIIKICLQNQVIILQPSKCKFFVILIKRDKLFTSFYYKIHFDFLNFISGKIPTVNQDLVRISLEQQRLLKNNFT